MYYVVNDDYVAEVINAGDMPHALFLEWARHKGKSVLACAVDMTVFTDDLETLDVEKETAWIKRVRDVELHNTPIRKRIRELDEELNSHIVTITAPIMYEGLMTMLDPKVREQRMRGVSDAFNQQIKDWENAGYKQYAVTPTGVMMCGPQFEAVLERQEDERKQLKADLWTI